MPFVTKIDSCIRIHAKANHFLSPSSSAACLMLVPGSFFYRQNYTYFLSGSLKHYLRVTST